MSEPLPPGPPADASGHLDLDGLADHLAGELDAGDHLAGCAGCAARLAELEAAEHLVVAALRSLVDPPMPTAAADRLAALLAAEPPLATPADGPAPAVPPAPDAAPAQAAPATVVPLAGRRRRPWVPAVAASAVLVAGGLLGYTLLGNGAGDGAGSATTATDSAAGATSRSPAAPTVTVASGLDYADAGSLARGLPAVLAGSAPASEPERDQQVAPGSAGPSSAALPAPVTSGSPESLAAAPLPDPLARLREPGALEDCLAVLLDPAEPDQRPIALDYARYDGAPALAVVLPDPDPSKLSVFVVGPGCSRADDELRFFTRLPRP